MSARISRLKRRSEFLRVAGARRKWVAPGLIVQARRHVPGEHLPPGASTIRVGYTASRKVGNAVVRNRVRRRLRAAVDLVLPREATEGHDFVVIGRAATADRPFAALVKDLRKALRKLGAARDRNGEKPGRGEEGE